MAKRFIYRYIRQVFYNKKAICRVLQWMNAVYPPSSDNCMYTAYQKQVFSLQHLKECLWYVECNKTYCYDTELDYKNLLGPLSGPEEEVTVVVKDVELRGKRALAPPMSPKSKQLERNKKAT